MQARSLGISAGRVTRGPLPEVDFSGYLILPGIVDLHADPSTDTAAPEGRLRSAAGTLAREGITTAWIAQGWSWEGGPSSPDAAERFARAARDDFGVDLRVSLKAETRLTEQADRLVALVRRHGVDLVVFQDSFPALAEIASSDPRRFAARAARAGSGPEDLEDAMRQARAQTRAVPRHLCRLADAFDALGVVYGSLGDPDAEAREGYSMIGARLCLFPASRRVAASANAMNDPVVLAAGDVAAERLPALDIVRDGLCAALASGSAPEAMTAAVWRLVDRGLLDLPGAWALVSEGPAEIARLPDRGRLDSGRRADFVVINAETRMVEASVAAGRLVFAQAGAAERFDEVLARGSLAAE